MEDGHSLVVSCPGSGKTTVLVTKAVRLAMQGCTVMAVTFNRDAADNIVKRTSKMSVPTDRIITGTFHALALRQVIVLGEKALLTDDERKAVIHEVVTDLKLAFNEDQIREYEKKAAEIIEKYKQGVRLSVGDQLIIDAYIGFMRSHGAIEFDDLISGAVNAMKQGTVKPYPVDHILVDEGQDQDIRQYAWIELHIRNGSKVTVVGDDDQSIYGFRSAMGYAGMTHFETLTNARRITLGVNYRSCREILSVADSLITKNKDRFEKQMISAVGDGATLSAYQYVSEEDEAKDIVERMKSDKGEWCIIGRSNQRLYQIEVALRLAGIKYRRLGGDSIWKLPFISAFLSVLRSFCESPTACLMSALRWAGCSGVEAGPIARALASHQIKDAPEHDDERVNELITSYPTWQSWYRAGYENLILTPVKNWVHKLLVASDNYKNWQSKLLDSVFNMLSATRGPLKQRLFRLTSKAVKENETKLNLSTIHGVKGLEYDAVWIAGFESGALPHKKSLTLEEPERTKAIDEERRLAYVALTRARQVLVISCLANKGFSQFAYEMAESNPVLANALAKPVNSLLRPTL